MRFSNFYNESIIIEMAYPITFDIEYFKNLKKHSEKVKYANENLLGKLGKGSARAVFKIDDEKCLKVVINEKGIAQNDSESDYTKKNYDILAKVYDSDPDGMWVEMELTKKITKGRFNTIMGFSLNDLEEYMIYRKRGTKFINNDLIKKLDNNEFVVELMDLAVNYEYSIPGDFGRSSSYGEVEREGKPKIVVIDYGLGYGVWDQYYKRK